MWTWGREEELQVACVRKLIVQVMLSTWAATLNLCHQIVHQKTLWKEAKSLLKKQTTSIELEQWIADSQLHWDISTMVLQKWRMWNQTLTCLHIDDLIPQLLLYPRWAWSNSKSKGLQVKPKRSQDPSQSISVLIIDHNNKSRSLTTHQLKGTPLSACKYKIPGAKLKVMLWRNSISSGETNRSHKPPSNSLCFLPSSSNNSKLTNRVWNMNKAIKTFQTLQSWILLEGWAPLEFKVKRSSQQSTSSFKIAQQKAIRTSLQSSKR